MYRGSRQDPAKVHDLIRRTSRFGTKVYTPIVYQYLGTPESEEGLRKLVRDVVKEFPEIKGVSRNQRVHPADGGVLVQEVGRDPRGEQGVCARLGAELVPRGRDRGRGMPAGGSGH